jgi:hypothetical protein
VSRNAGAGGRQRTCLQLGWSYVKPCLHLLTLVWLASRGGALRYAFMDWKRWYRVGSCCC